MFKGALSVFANYRRFTQEKLKSLQLLYIFRSMFILHVAGCPLIGATMLTSHDQLVMTKLLLLP